MISIDVLIKKNFTLKLTFFHFPFGCSSSFLNSPRRENTFTDEGSLQVSATKMLSVDTPKPIGDLNFCWKSFSFTNIGTFPVGVFRARLVISRSLGRSVKALGPLGLFLILLQALSFVSALWDFSRGRKETFSSPDFSEFLFELFSGFEWFESDLNTESEPDSKSLASDGGEKWVLFFVLYCQLYEKIFLKIIIRLWDAKIIRSEIIWTFLWPR